MHRERWDERHRDADYLGEPAPFLEQVLPSLPRGRALDVACGLGANALRLAAAGFEVEALDWSFEALRKLRAAAEIKKLSVRGIACDLTRFPLPSERYAVVTCFRFLDRTLWPALLRALEPEGALIVETFTKGYLSLKPDFPPEYCLETGELLRAFATTLRVERYVELPSGSTASLLGIRGSIEAPRKVAADS